MPFALVAEELAGQFADVVIGITLLRKRQRAFGGGVAPCRLFTSGEERGRALGDIAHVFARETVAYYVARKTVMLVRKLSPEPPPTMLLRATSLLLFTTRIYAQFAARLPP